MAHLGLEQSTLDKRGGHRLARDLPTGAVAARGPRPRGEAGRRQVVSAEQSLQWIVAQRMQRRAGASSYADTPGEHRSPSSRQLLLRQPRASTAPPRALGHADVALGVIGECSGLGGGEGAEADADALDGVMDLGRPTCLCSPWRPGIAAAPMEQPDTAPLPVLTVDQLQKTDQRHRGLPRQIKKINETVWTTDTSLQKFMDLKNNFRS